MLLFQDKFTDAEVFTDALPFELVDDVAYEIKCSFINVKEGVDVDIGANPSAEEQEEALEEGTKRVVDVVHFSKLDQAIFNKPRDYLVYLKGYLAKIKESLPEERKAGFEGAFQRYAKKIGILPKFEKFENFEFYYCNTEEVTEGMIPLLDWRKDDAGNETPYLIVWKEGVKEVKL